MDRFIVTSPHQHAASVHTHAVRSSAGHDASSSRPRSVADYFAPNPSGPSPSGPSPSGPSPSGPSPSGPSPSGPSPSGPSPPPSPRFPPSDRAAQRILVFTDGSCLNNGKHTAVGGIGVFFGDGDARNKCARFTPQNRNALTSDPDVPAPDAITNQTMELLAAIHGLRAIAASSSAVVVLYTDSQYVVNCVNVWSRQWMRNGWRTAKDKGRVQNMALIKTLLTLANTCRARLVHTRAHREAPPAGCSSEEYNIWYGNKRADALANAAARGLVKCN